MSCELESAELGGVPQREGVSYPPRLAATHPLAKAQRNRVALGPSRGWHNQSWGCGAAVTSQHIALEARRTAHVLLMLSHIPQRVLKTFLSDAITCGAGQSHPVVYTLDRGRFKRRL